MKGLTSATATQTIGRPLHPQAAILKGPSTQILGLSVPDTIEVTVLRAKGPSIGVLGPFGLCNLPLALLPRRSFGSRVGALRPSGHTLGPYISHSRRGEHVPGGVQALSFGICACTSRLCRIRAFWILFRGFGRYVAYCWGPGNQGFGFCGFRFEGFSPGTQILRLLQVFANQIQEPHLCFDV